MIHGGTVSHRSEFQPSRDWGAPWNRAYVDPTDRLANHILGSYMANTGQNEGGKRDTMYTGQTGQISE